MIEHLIISYPNSDIIKQNSFSHLIKTITYNLSIKEYPSLSIFESLENINIFTYGNESIIKDNFISSKEVNIIIIGNIQKIDDKSFLNSRINNFLYCGDQEVEGNFLIGRHPRNITVYEYYPKSKIGDVAASKTGKCNNLPGDVKHGLTNTQLALIITFSIIVLIAIFIAIFIVIKLQNVIKSQKKIEGKMLLEKLVVDEFG